MESGLRRGKRLDLILREIGALLNGFTSGSYVIEIIF